jgi:ribA/ribD-fused uncharacterized protein
MNQLPTTLNQSYCYIPDNPHNRALLVQWGFSYNLPGWVPQREVSRALFGQGGYQTIVDCERQYGAFVWGTQFANVHSTFHFVPPHITIDGETWAGSEQYYQAMKSFGNPDHDEAKAAIRMATPMEAWSLGQRYSCRSDWRSVSVDVMRKAVTAKFTQDVALKNLLLSTMEHPLVQVKPGDDFWGTGRRSNGRNMLGVLLQELRATL